MSDPSGGLGSGTDTRQGDQARANQAREGFAALRGARSERDVSRAKNYTVKAGSSTKDQATKGQS